VKGRFALWLFAVTVFWTLLWSGQRAVWGDSVLDFEAARGLLHEGSLSIGAPIRPDLHLGAAGRYYVKYSLLQTLPLVPAAALFEACLVGQSAPPPWSFLAMALPAALLAGWGVVGLWLFLVRLQVPIRQAGLAALMAFLSSPWWVYGRCYFGENLQAGMACWLLWAWLGTRRAGANTVGLGLLGGLCLNCKPTFALWLLVLLGDQILLGLRYKDLPLRLAYGLLGLAPGLFMLVGYNLFRYGSALRIGYDYGRDQDLGFATPLWVGLHGLLLSSGKSIFLYAPVLLLLPVAARFWLVRYRRETQLIGLICLLQLCLVSCWWAWSGDWAWGPRLVVVLLPILSALVYAAQPRGARWLCALGLAVNFLGVLVPAGVYLRQTMAANQGMMQHRELVVDDSLLIHYVPDFSPVVGHAWMLGTKWGLTREPWRFRNVQEWNPKEIEDFRLDLWWGSDPLSIALWLALLFGLAGSGLALYRSN